MKVKVTDSPFREDVNVFCVEMWSFMSSTSTARHCYSFIKKISSSRPVPVPGNDKCFGLFFLVRQRGKPGKDWMLSHHCPNTGCIFIYSTSHWFKNNCKPLGILTQFSLLPYYHLFFVVVFVEATLQLKVLLYITDHFITLLDSPECLLMAAQNCSKLQWTMASAVQINND